MAQLNPNHAETKEAMEGYFNAIIRKLHEVECHKSAKAMRWTRKYPFAIFQVPWNWTENVRFVNNHNPDDLFYVHEELSSYDKVFYLPFNVERLPGDNKFKAYL